MTLHTARLPPRSPPGGDEVVEEEALPDLLVLLQVELCATERPCQGQAAMHMCVEVGRRLGPFSASPTQPWLGNASVGQLQGRQQPHSPSPPGCAC